LYDNHVVTPAMIVVPRRRVCYLNSLILVFSLFLFLIFLKRKEKFNSHILSKLGNLSFYVEYIHIKLEVYGPFNKNKLEVYVK